MKHLDKIFVIIAAILVITVLVYGPWEKSWVGVIVDPLLEPTWEKILPRNLIKSTAMITLIEKDGNNCLMDGLRVGDILRHPHFVKSAEFAKKINYNNSTNQITIPCSELHGEQSRLHVWYVDKESPEDAGKYQYWITDLNATEPDL